MMRYGRIAGVEKPFPRLVQGTVMVSSSRLDESFALLDGVFQLGGTAFDTAHVYGGGDNERTVGRWIRDRGIRDQAILIGKGAHPYEGRNRVTPEDLTADVSESLDRFELDSMDLYLLHRDDESVPVGEIVDALDGLASKGRFGAYGGSNWRQERIAAANEHAAQNGRRPFVASSPQFGLAWPQKPIWEGCLTIGGSESVAREWYRRAGLALLPWSSLGGGFFSGRFSRDNLATFDAYLDRLCAECYGHEENFRRLDRARQLAAAKGAAPPQIALAWLFAQGMDVFPLVGCASPAEFAENARALSLELTPEEARWLEVGGPVSPTA
jgi:aryl-alcohol dehydrogenase-like predicted oxidoreductase